MENRARKGTRAEQKTEESFSIKDYWDEALRKVKKKASR
jgi:hypothetical protein